MIGNDIVDLKIASLQSNWKRKGWLQKIFTQSEQNLIAHAENPDQMVWKLWSMKEAAYKAHQRRFSLLPKYNPKDFICHDTTVDIDGFVYQTISKYEEDYIHSIAYTNRDDFISKVFVDTSKQYKNQVKYYVGNLLNVHISAVTLQKDANRIPNIRINNKETKAVLSLSSHGSFSAFTIILY